MEPSVEPAAASAGNPQPEVAAAAAAAAATLDKRGLLMRVIYGFESACDF